MDISSISEILKSECKIEKTPYQKGNHEIMKSISSFRFNGFKFSSSAYNYKGDIVKFLSVDVSIGVTIGEKAGFETTFNVSGFNGLKAGFEATFNILEFNGSGLKTNLGISTSTGISISKQCFEIKFAGFGIKLGYEMGINTSFGGVSLNIGNLLKRSKLVKTIIERCKNITNSEVVLNNIVNHGINIGKDILKTKNCDTKVDNEIDVNAFTGGESFNIIKTVTDVICNNE
ncbi:3836_t:CDS:1, partial [Racocetra persica]